MKRKFIQPPSVRRKKRDQKRKERSTPEGRIAYNLYMKFYQRIRARARRAAA